MNAQTQESGKKRRTIRLVLGLLTVVLLVFFTIPSISSWWAVFNLRGIETRLQGTEKQLAVEQDALEKLEAKMLMSPSDPAAQEKVVGEIRKLQKSEASIRAARDEDKKSIEKAKGKLSESSTEWWKT